MTLIVPDYYPLFSCIKGDCRHSCCIGWEIGIDEDSLHRYETLPGPMGDKIRSRILRQADGAVFALTPEERCPFLNEDGLCDMILTLGEDSLCRICADHPRFRNPFSTHTEMGLGLCCEAAAALILKRQQPMTLISSSGDIPCPDEEEQSLLALRDEWLHALQNRTIPFIARLQTLAAQLPMDIFSLSPAFLAQVLLSLERLDDSWTEQLHLLEKSDGRLLDASYDMMLEQLSCYLLFRHLPGALDDALTAERLALCLLLTRGISMLGAMQGECFTPDVFCDLCRMMSAEIEYSDENLDRLLDMLADL